MFFILQTEGFEQISVEPVVAQPDRFHMQYREEDLPQIPLMNSMIALRKKSLREKKAGKGFNFFHFMIDLTWWSMCSQETCQAVVQAVSILAVTPWGDFYPCHQFVGE